MSELFSSHEDSKKLAELIEATGPCCQCESISVGQGTPGPVASEETLLRIIVSPRDIDDDGYIFLEPFKKVYANGLSVCRDIASDHDVTELTKDGIRKPGSHVKLILAARTSDVRSKCEGEERLYCVYDHTVSRHDPQLKPVPTHAGIFLRFPPKNFPNGNALRTAFAEALRELFISKQYDPQDFRGGLLVQLNSRPAHEAG